MDFHYIAVEGPIGVGKSSFCELLGTHLKAQKVLEDLNNPFLKDFYKETPGSAFQLQLFFLLMRYQQQQKLQQADLFQETIVCDYIFQKDKIFAYLNLSDNELLIYERLYSLLEPNIPRPDLVIYLQASLDVLLQRIKKRNVDYEKTITRDYLKELMQAYNYFFFHYKLSSLLVINTSDIDFVENPKDMEDLVTMIRTMGKGTKYYIPLGSR
ncbi:MAG TPA: deoxynucleoside kinase [Acidobacteriota bacterium]|jgi:deoxyadenosine/deoxycytidine kinase|nr:deoxynucleoside kinase [Acidobacteriota bacterium]